MWFNLDDDDRRLLRTLADAYSFGREVELVDKAKLVALQTRIGDQETEQAGLQAFRDAVDTSDELECDDGAIVSQGDDGAFVMTWSYVTNEAAGIETPDEDEDAEQETAA